jgi:hypothetical protein
MVNQNAQPLKRRRWWRWLFYLTVTGLVALSAFAYWAWKERVMLVNAALLRLGGDVRVQITSLEWEDGALHMREVSTLHVPLAQSVGGVGHVEWRPSWSQLRTGNLGGFKVEGATVDVPLSWFEPATSQPGTAAAAAGTSRRWRLEFVDLTEAKLVVRDAAWKPLFSVIVTQKVEALEVGGPNSPSIQTIVTDLRQAEWGGKPVFNDAHLEMVMREDHLDINKASLHGGNVDLAWLKEISPALAAQLPPLIGGMQLEWEGRDMRLSSAGLTAGGTHELRLKKLRVQPQDDAGAVTADAVDLKVSQDATGLWHVQNSLLLKPVVNWTPKLEALLLPKEESTSKAVWKVLVDALEVKDGTVNVSATELCPVAGGFRWNARLAALEITPGSVKSASKQTLEIMDLSLRWGRSENGLTPPPFFQLKSLQAEVVPDKLLDTWQVESLVMTKPHLELTPENGPWFDKIVSEPVKPPPGPAEAPAWQRLGFDHLSVQDGSLTMAMQLAERVEASTSFKVSTEQNQQHLTIENTRVRIPKRANLPVLSLEKVEASAVLPEMWRTRRVESLKLSGGQIEVGDALMTLFTGQSAVVEEKLEVTAERWTAKKIEVEKLGVTLMSIAPGLPPVRFDVTFAANETPLDLDGLAENVEPQRIVLTRLRIPSPHEPLRTVAEMDVIQVSYTLDGLLKRRIDRVEIVSPLLYVGEDLFWYVDSYRKFMKGEPAKPDATAGPPPPPKPTAPGWRVDTLAVTDGRLLLAPKGVPLKGFSKPFPFSFTSKLESGQLDAVFDIPTDDYTLEELKIQFRGMKGQVRFNLPMKDRDNNLTETFTVQQLRWKELHLEKAHLSVTYDVNGIYGAFGGEAYGGYVNGAFNIYLDEVFTWDGWVSGVDVKLGPVTRVLFPGYLLLEGAAEGKLIATGNMNELYQADGEFKNRSRGKFSIQALNDMISELPPVMKGDIADQITRIGLETLRDFEYDSIDGKARFYGREGRGHLRLTGPHGARKLDINVYDHRWKEEPRKTDTADAVE